MALSQAVAEGLLDNLVELDLQVGAYTHQLLNARVSPHGVVIRV